MRHPAAARPLLVTHQVNISALTGEFARSGEIILAVQNEDGRPEMAGRFLLEGR